MRIELETAMDAIDPGPMTIDLPWLIDSRMLIKANSRGEKTHHLRLIAERAADKAQVVFLDRGGDFATHRERLARRLGRRDPG
jgi:hypothetical protein